MVLGSFELKRVGVVKVNSLFSGCGGLDFGFNEAGFETTWANEISADASESFKYLTGHLPTIIDINEVLGDIPAAEFLIGGPPCQSFSLVGQRVEADPRSQLVFSYFQAVRSTKPLAFVMENVTGILSSKIDGVPLPEILKGKFEAIGYKTKLVKINAADYFVPQRRKRVFLVGVLGGNFDFQLITPGVYADILGISPKSKWITSKEALGDLPEPSANKNFGQVPYGKSPVSDFARLMRKDSTGGVTLHSYPTMSRLDAEFVRHIPPGGNYTSIPDDISTPRILRIKKEGGRTTTYGRLHPDFPSHTINTYFNRPNVGSNYHYDFERLITAREALRLQSFPDRFTPHFSSQRSLHQQIGNAVPPLLARAIAESLRVSMTNE